MNPCVLIHMKKTEMFERFLSEMKIRNYSRKTVKSYSSYLNTFLSHAEKYPEIEPADRIFLFLKDFDSSEASYQAFASIKLFYKLVLKKDCPYILKGVRKKKRLPTVISHGDIIRLLNTVANSKHRLMLCFLYGSGLRVSEVVKIRIQDLDLLHKKLIVRQGKGKKDRITILSEKLIPEIQELVRGKKGSDFLFLSRMNKPYSVRTVQTIFTKALNKAEIPVNAGCHSLRHSFATHLMESGMNVKSIKMLLGHKSIKTTMKYVHVADMLNQDITSPL